MWWKQMVLFIILSSGLANGAFAQNRDSVDRIFPEPTKAGWPQILLGLTQLWIANSLYSYLTPEQNMLKNAALNLQIAQDLPVSEEQRERMITAILNNAEKIDDSNAPESIISQSTKKRIERIQLADLVTATEKKVAIKIAQEQLAATRTTYLKVAQNMGWLDKSLRILRLGTAVVLVGDVIGRVYVWNALDANPTLSPTATYLQHLIQK